MGYRILLTEGESALAQTFIRRFEDYSFSLVVGGPEVNWSDVDQVEVLLDRKKPSLVINTLAISCLQSLSFDKSVLELAKLCASRSIPVFHLSSYEVFSGSGEEELNEALPPQSSSPQGQYLLEQEAAVLALDCGIVLRLSWLIDAAGQNLLTEICQRLVQKQPLLVSDSAHGSPTHYDDIFRVVAAMIQQTLCGAENWGVFHLCTSDQCVEAEFTDFISRILHAENIEVGEYQVRSDGPSLTGINANLQGRRCNNNFGVQLRSWRQGVKALVMGWLESQAD